MDISELKRQSDASYDIAVAKRNALEKANSRLSMVYEEHIFRADAETICLVKTLSENNQQIFLLDTNANPVEIRNPSDFLTKLIQRNQESLRGYSQAYHTFTKRDI